MSLKRRMYDMVKVKQIYLQQFQIRYSTYGTTAYTVLNIHFTITVLYLLFFTVHEEIHFLVITFRDEN